ncbi:MAG: sialidase family protein [Gemmatimonadaceae bacterium]
MVTDVRRYRRRGMSAAVCFAAATAGCAGAGSPDGSSLGPIATLAPPAGVRSAEPNLAVGPDGRVWLSWLEPLGDTATALRLSAYDGAVWSAPTTVVARSDLFVNWADFPSVFATANGRLIAHWLQRSDTARYAYDVRVSQSADGGATWSTSLVVHRDGTRTEHGFVTLFAAAAGDSVAAVWLDGRRFAGENADDQMQLATTTIAGDGSLGIETLLDERICDCCQTDAALTARGAVVVYRDRSPEEIRDIYLVRRDDAAGWGAAIRVHADGWRIPGCPVNGPAVAARGDTVAVAWFTAANDTGRVRVAYSQDAGETFNAPQRIDDGNPIGRVDVQLIGGGRGVVTWLERLDSARAAIRVRVVSPNGSARHARTIVETPAARSSGFPRTVQRGNELIFAWTAPGDSGRVNVARAAIR